MPVTLVGREGHFHGKSLYYIARNLRNLGVGRMVIRNNFVKRYKEPCFYRLTEVRPEMNAKGYFRGVAYGECVFRGTNLGVHRIDSGHKQDWRLIPKEKESEYMPPGKIHKVKKDTRPVQEMELPPLMQLILEDELLSENLPVPESGLKCNIKRKKRNVENVTFLDAKK